MLFPVCLEASQHSLQSVDLLFKPRNMLVLIGYFNDLVVQFLGDLVVEVQFLHSHFIVVFKFLEPDLLVPVLLPHVVWG